MMSMDLLSVVCFLNYNMHSNERVIMKRSKRINRNLTVIGIIILGFLVYVFGGDVLPLDTLEPTFSP